MTLPLASVPRRVGSICYELLLLGGVLLVAGAVFQPIFNGLGHPAWLDVLYRVYLVLVLGGYFGFSWCRGGQTLAMKTWKLQLVTSEGQGLSYQKAAIRYMLALVLLLGVPVLTYFMWRQVSGGDMRTSGWMAASLLLVPFVWAAWDPERQFLHDRLAGTRVVWVGAKVTPPLA